MNLAYPVSTWELPIGSTGCCGNHHRHDPVESISVNVGDHSKNAKESGSTDVETRHKSSDVLEWSQRGHRVRWAATCSGGLKSHST